MVPGRDALMCSPAGAGNVTTQRTGNGDLLLDRPDDYRSPARPYARGTLGPAAQLMASPPVQPLASRHSMSPE